MSDNFYLLYLVEKKKVKLLEDKLNLITEQISISQTNEYTVTIKINSNKIESLKITPQKVFDITQS